jgi:hypothetical protein
MPFMLLFRALAPVAVFWLLFGCHGAHYYQWPCCCFRCCHGAHSNPIAVLKEPVLSIKSASNPIAVLFPPVVRLKSALVPSAVLPPGYPPSGGGGGSSACAAGKSPKQTSTTRSNVVALLSWISGFMVLPFFFPLRLFCDCGSRGGEEHSGGNALRLIQIRLATVSFDKILLGCQDNSLPARTIDSSSTNAVSFSSACTTKRFLSR